MDVAAVQRSCFVCYQVQTLLIALLHQTHTGLLSKWRCAQYVLILTRIRINQR